MSSQKYLFCLIFLLLSFFSTFAQEEVSLRLMAANITSGEDQSYDAGHGNRIFQALQPDIVLIQEFNVGNNSSSTIQAWVQSTFGSNYSYYRESNAQIPNGIISRYPILAKGEWNDSQVSNRDFAWARIDIPGPKDLWAVSVHFLTTSASLRNQEATQLVGYIQSNIPSGDYLVIGGDFNTKSRNESAINTLGSVVVKSGPYPVDKNGNGNTNGGRNEPYDWILVNNPLHQLKTTTSVGSQNFSNGLVFDSRKFVPLSDVSPVQFNDSGATNMQHMAVIRDYLIPTGGTGGGTTPPDPTPGSGLENGQTISDTVNSGNWHHFYLEVPTNTTQLNIQVTANGSGDADLYVKKTGQPTSSAYDFRPYLSGSNETVTISTSSSPPISGGGWYIGIYGYSTAGYNLTVNWNGSSQPTPPPTTSTTVLDQNDSANQGQWKNYTITVPSGKTQMSIQLTGTGDGDLYVKKGSLPTSSSYDFRPYQNGTNETVQVNGTSNPVLSEGTWYVSVYGYSAATYNIKVILQ